MTRKSLVIVVVLIAAAAAAFAAPVTINALFMKQAGYQEEDIIGGTRDFQSAHPEINVNLTFVPYEQLEEKIITSAQAGSYDVVLSDGPFTAKFAQAGIVKAVPALASADQKDIFEGALLSTLYKGKSYGMPWLNDCKYLFYNKKVLAAAGFANPPKSWEELLAQAKVIKDMKLVKYPIAWSWAQAECLTCDYTVLSAAFGGAMFDKDGNPTVTAAGNKKALDFMVASLKDGITNPNSLEFTENEVDATFIKGDAAFALNWTYQFNEAQDASKSAVVGQVGIALIPGSGSIRSATVNGGQPLSISAGSKRSAEAWQYILYMSSKDFQKKFPKNALPIWKSLYDDKDIIATSPEVVKIAKDQYNYLVNRPVVPFYSEFSTDLQVRLQEALQGKKTSDQALKEVQAKALELAGRK
ncbi:MAG: extracellular solute-binding protein [Spirochaetia bacterium]|jgi:multiple sugar transport system substrate-binding protein